MSIKPFMSTFYNWCNLKKLMILIAFIAIACWIAKLYRSALKYDKIAAYYSEKASTLNQSYPGPEGKEPQIAHYRYLAKKYRSASRSPWLPLDPDPVEPPETLLSFCRRTCRQGYISAVLEKALLVALFDELETPIGTELIVFNTADSSNRRLRIVGIVGHKYVAQESGNKISDDWYVQYQEVFVKSKE